MGEKKQAGKVQISNSPITRNMNLSLIGQPLLLLVAVIVMPFIIRGLRTEDSTRYPYWDAIGVEER